MRDDSGTLAILVVLCCTVLTCVGCGDGDVPVDEVPILSPEPMGAPALVAGGRLTCLGDNAAPTPVGTNITLPGWARTLSDRANDGGAQPSARVEVVNADGVSLGVGFSDTANGRVAVTVPVPMTGFTGHVQITADGFRDVNLYSSRPYASTGYPAWVWLITDAEMESAATVAGETLDPARGVLVGAVHDCDIFGIANAVVTVEGDTTGVFYFEDYTLTPGRTFSDTSGRFAVADLEPGPLTVEAFGRMEADGPLLLLSRADVNIVAGAVTEVDLEPRVAIDR